MFSKAVRFPKEAFSTPAPGQYDTNSTTLKNTGCPEFSSVPRFDPETARNLDVLDSSGPALKSCLFTPRHRPVHRNSVPDTENRRLRQMASELRRVESELNDALLEIARLQDQKQIADTESGDSRDGLSVPVLEGRYEYVKQSLEADVEAANKQIKHITHRNQELEELLDENQDHMDRVEQENLELHRIVVELQDKIELMAKEISSYQQTVSGLEKKYSESCQDSEGLYESVQMLNEEVKNKTNELEQLKFDMRQQQDAMQLMTTQYQSQEVEIRHLTSQIAMAKTDFEEKQEVVLALEMQLADAKQQLAHKTRCTENTIQQLEMECQKAVESQTAVESACREKLETAENEKNNLITSLGECDAEIERLKMDAVKLIDQCNQLSHDKDKLETSMVEKQQKIDELLEQTEQLQKTNGIASERLQSQELQVEEIKHERDELQNKVTEVQTASTCMQKEYQSKIDELAQELEALQESHQQQLNFLSTSIEENNSLTARLQDLETAIEVYKEEIAVAKEEAETSERCYQEDQANAQRIKEEMNRLIIDMQTKVADTEQKHKKELDELRHLLALKSDEASQLQTQLKQTKKTVFSLEEKEHLQSEAQTWHKLYSELEERCRPFQEQLELYEVERRALMSEKTEAEIEVKFYTIYWFKTRPQWSFYQ
jgi:chromosome segregation ATPase